MDIKENIINQIVQAMSVTLDGDQLKTLLYTMSGILKDMDIVVKEGSTLPAVQNNGNRLIDGFIANKKLKGCTDTTLEAYRRSVLNFYTFMDEKSLTDITTNDIRYFLAEYGKHVKNSSVDNMRRNLNSFFTWMAKEDIIDKNPCARIDKIKSEIPVYTPVTQTDVVKLKDHCIDIREVVLVDLLESCGLRCMEIPTIKISDIAFESHTMVVHGKGRKQRKVVLNSECLEHIRVYMDERREKGIECPYLIMRQKHNELMDKPLCKDAIADMLKRIRERAKVEHVKIHGLRHKFATDLNRKGMNIFDIQALLGHSSIATTQIYVNSSFDNITREYSKYVS